MVFTRYTARLLHVLGPATLAAQMCSGTMLSVQQMDDRLIRQYSPLVWEENLALRPNGNILAVSNTSPILQQLEPKTNRTLFSHDFSAHGNAIQGITEVSPDVFAIDVLTCDIVGTQTCTSGSGSVWRVDFRKCSKSVDLPEVSRVAVLPDAGLLNGMATLDSHEGTILMADSLFGSIFRANIWSGEAGFLFTDPAMRATSEVPSSINGIRVVANHLYFTNSARGNLNRIQIHPRTGLPSGNVSVIASDFVGPDDFEIDAREEVAYVCDGIGNRLLAVCLRTGSIELGIDLPGPTSARWAPLRGRETSRLVVSTSGGLKQYIDHNVTIGGAIYEVEVRNGLKPVLV
jgi:hypothetical protein